ncbi:hypothetical protein HYQ46_003324 [Verticillium longisporum]|nr:hypothetical protein HYQ46_003324 [Verticillium longisporum]
MASAGAPDLRDPECMNTRGRFVLVISLALIHSHPHPQVRPEAEPQAQGSADRMLTMLDSTSKSSSLFHFILPLSDDNNS